MTRQELLEKLKEIKENNLEFGDPQSDHGMADQLLLDYINDTAISKAFNAIEKWYV